MNYKDIFVQTIQKSGDIPDFIKKHAYNTKDIEENVLDESYLDFLRTQIQLNARDDEWLNTLKIRMKALSDYVGKTLVSGLVVNENTQYHIKIDPETHKVLYYERL